MNEREHAVLSLFYHEGNRELTPSFLAYRMRMSTRDATALLDKMVKHGTLDLDVDDDGNLLYRLPESERRLLEEQIKAQNPPHTRPSGPSPGAGRGHAASDNARPYIRRQPSSQGQQPQGTDANAGYGPTQATTGSNPAVSHRQSAHDGTDGSLYPTTSPGRHDSRPHGHTAATSGPSTSQFAYDDWYKEESAPGGQHSTATAPRQGPHGGYAHAPPHSAPSPTDQYGTIPERQALAPYQTAEHHPAHRPGPYPDRERIPVLAGALSLLVPGLGQFYNGEVGKGIMLLFSCLLLSVFLLFWIVWIWSVIDAYMVAEQSNQRALMDESPSPHPPLLPDQRPPTSTTNSNAA